MWGLWECEATLLANPGCSMALRNGAERMDCLVAPALLGKLFLAAIGEIWEELRL